MKTKTVPYVKILEKERMGRKQGLIVSTVISLLSIIFTLPFFPWIYVGGELTKEGLKSSYSTLNFLSYVRITVQGILGLPTMLIMLVAIAAALLHLLSSVRVIFNKYGAKGLLGYYTLTKAATFLSFLATAGLFVFLSFTDGMKLSNTFAVAIVPYVIMLISVVGNIIVTVLEKRERIINKEHGFFEEFRRNWILFLFLIPCFVYFLINHYLPMVGIYFAFTNFNFRDGLFASPYVGWKNFEHLVKAELFKLTRNTVLYNIAFILIGNVMQIIFAILTSRVLNKAFKKVSQTMIFMPYFVSFVILRVLTYNMFEYKTGLINSMLAASGLPPLDIYNNPKYWPFIIIIFYLWKNIGYGMVVYLASIMGISDEYYEAARVDGANVFQQIRYITIPLLKPTFIILFLYSVGGILRGQFELFYQLVGSNGVLFNVTDILDTFVYRITTATPLSMGWGAAAGLYQSVFGFIIILVTNAIVKRRNSEYTLF
ncbi:MAG: ABC transporter permease subunit [Oscillospiraceae bacterium]|nr:ABC transporter permease subunit [Oscillospiraceae bacterium]